MNAPSSASSSAFANLTSAISRLKIGTKAVVDPVKKTAIELGMKVTGLHENVRHEKDEYRELLETLDFLTTQVLDALPLYESINDAVTREAIDSLKRAVVSVKLALDNEGQEQEVRLFGLASHSLDALRQRLDRQSLRFTLSVAAQSVRDRASHPKISADRARLNPPPKPAIFCGRDELVQSLVDLLLKDETCRLPLLGTGGIGKTSLAAAILHDERVKKKFEMKIFFLSCEALVSASGIVVALASALGLQTDGGARQALLNYLSTLKHVVLCLDNLETVWDTEERLEIEAFLADITAVPALSLIVTMRGALRPAGVEWSDCILNLLHPLPLEASRDMWMRIAKNTDSKLDELLRLLDGLPLAITLMAQHGQIMSPTELIDSYNHERTALIARGKPGRLTSLDVSIEVSFNCPSMCEEPQAQNLLSVLALLPDGASVSDLEHMLPSMPQCRRVIRVLLQVALAISRNGRISTLAPIREFVLSRYPLGERHLNEVRVHFECLVTGVGIMGSAAFKQRADKLREEFENTNSVLLHLLWLADFTRSTGYGDCIHLLAKAGQYLQETGDQWNAARCNWIMGEVLRILNRYSEAMDKLEQAKATFDELDDRRSVARCNQIMGDVLRMLNRYSEAMDKLEQAKTTFDDLDDRRSVAQCNQIMGDVLRIGMCVVRTKPREPSVLGSGSVPGLNQDRTRTGSLLVVRTVPNRF